MIGRVRPLLITLAILALLAGDVSSTDAATTTLAAGDRGGDVATWQTTVNRAFLYLPTLTSGERRFLRLHGHLVVDGAFGPLTEQATRLYQRQWDRRPTGVVENGDWTASMADRLGNCCAGLPPRTVAVGADSVLEARRVHDAQRDHPASHRDAVVLATGRLPGV